MQVETLKLFCDLVETHSFTRAVDKNYITQSAVTQMLQHLERDTGETLVLRGGHQFQLTRAGGAVCGRRLHRTAGRHLPGKEETHTRDE